MMQGIKLAIPHVFKDAGLTKWTLFTTDLDGSGKLKKPPLSREQHRITGGIKNLMTAKRGDLSQYITAEEVEEWRNGPDKPNNAKGYGAMPCGKKFCIDLDGVIDSEGRVHTEAMKWVRRLDTFTEISVSGTGLHIWGLAKDMPKHLMSTSKVSVTWARSVEAYDGWTIGNYVAITGNALKGFDVPIRECSGEYLEFLTALGFGVDGDLTEEAATSPYLVPSKGKDYEDEHSDSEIIALFKQNNQQGMLTKLWKGEVQKDDSSEMMRLCDAVASYTRDAEQIERIVSGSPFAKRYKKWQERDAWVKLTCANAVKYMEVKQPLTYFEEEAKEAKEKKQQAAITGGLLGNYELPLGRNGKPTSTLGTIEKILLNHHELLGVIVEDVFLHKAVLRVDTEMFGKAGVMEDHHLTGAAIYLEDTFKMSSNKAAREDLKLAIGLVTSKNKINSLTEAFEALPLWDGVPRLNTWLFDLMGVKRDNNRLYVETVGRMFLLGATARALYPGVKMDNVLILEGAQGVQKSSACRVLCDGVKKGIFGEAPNLTNDKEVVISLAGKLICELGEMAHQSKSDVQHIKRIIAQTVDEGRLNFANGTTQRPRIAVFIGTVNPEDGYLSDGTGNRRYWPVAVTAVDLVGLKQAAPQLWAEAYATIKKGELVAGLLASESQQWPDKANNPARWWLEKGDEALKQAEAMQRERMPDNILHGMIFEKILGGTFEGGKRLAAGFIYKKLFPDAPTPDKGKQMEMAKALTHCGMDKPAKGFWVVGELAKSRAAEWHRAGAQG